MEALAQKLYEEFVAIDNDYAEGESPFGICTNCAKWLKQNHFPDGVVMGYHHSNNPTAVVGKAEGGHDFLIVRDNGSEWILDFWHRLYYHYELPIAIHYSEWETLYGDPLTFEEAK